MGGSSPWLVTWWRVVYLQGQDRSNVNYVESNWTGSNLLMTAIIRLKDLLGAGLGEDFEDRIISLYYNIKEENVKRAGLILTGI